MPYQLDDTIVAIASPPGPAARGIVRLSGRAVADVLRCCFAASAAEPGVWHTARRARHTSGTLQLDHPLGPLDCTLYYWPTQRSYTREPSAELHLIGAPVILDSAVASCCRAGARLAEPGEFTLRAFLAGRIDLTQAEAVLGVIDARSQAELEVALKQLGGGLRTPLHQLRDGLLDLLAHLEAGLDFVEEDIEFISAEELQRQMMAAHQQLLQLAQRMRERTSNGDYYRVVLRGLPNTGKSSLLNALAGRPAAIVSDEAGTTRDYITVRQEIAGLDCLLIDTAGLEAADTQAVRAAAQAAAEQQGRAAHLELLCIDSSRSPAAWELDQLAALAQTPRLVVLTKCDRPAACASMLGRTQHRVVRTSAASGAGLESLRQAMASELETAGTSDFLAGTSVRCHDSMLSAAEALERAVTAVSAGLGEELIASEVRLALEALGGMVGAVYTDDVLDRIFSRFCIGK